jgi:hypothetical protein
VDAPVRGQKRGALIALAALGFVGLVFLYLLHAGPVGVPASSTGRVSLVSGESFCSASGIDDAYTGTGHVRFFLTLQNEGGSSKRVSLTPVRHYDDGALNDSALDTVEVEIPGAGSWSGRTPAFTYKAHEHELVACGVIVDDGEEIPIGVNHL